MHAAFVLGVREEEFGTAFNAILPDKIVEIMERQYGTREGLSEKANAWILPKIQSPILERMRALPVQLALVSAPSAATNLL